MKEIENRDLDLETRVHLGLVAQVALSRVDEVKRTLAEMGVDIVYQRVSIEPLRIVAAEARP